jgi:hypothetical protein
MKFCIPIIFSLALCAGCASSIVPMGKDTYMVERGGWPHMNEFAMEADCLKAANRFCKKRGMAMVVVSTTGRDGQVFANNASCRLIFKTVPTNSPLNVVPEYGEEHLVH